MIAWALNKYLILVFEIKDLKKKNPKFSSPTRANSHTNYILIWEHQDLIIFVRI